MAALLAGDEVVMVRNFSSKMNRGVEILERGGTEVQYFPQPTSENPGQQHANLVFWIDYSITAGSR